MCEISVIIPVYNVEDYLGACLESVLNQSFEDIEVICINDGSTDNSLEILEDYARNDNRIRILTQENKGLGASRNRGLKESQGKYVYFIDSDDYIELNALEKLHNSAIDNNSDIVIFKFQTFAGDKKEVGFKLDKIFGDIDYGHFKFTYRDVMHHVLNSAYSACAKLYKKQFLDSFDDFYFPEDVYYEDVLFHVKAMIRASAISFVPEELYNYRVNPASISNSNENPFDIFKVIDMVESFLRQQDYDEFETEFIIFKISQTLQYMFSSQSNDYFNRAKDEFKQMEIKNENLIKKHWIDSYKLVRDSENLEDFLLNYYNKQISDLTKQNNDLKRQNKILKCKNQKILSSNSWKITKPLRDLKRFR